MKLQIFLNTVDACTNKMSHENIEKFVHELARKLPESQRDAFISNLTTLSDAPVDVEVSDEKAILSVETEIERIIGILEEISAGDRCLDSEYNEEWDDWYNSDVDEFRFFDPQKLLVNVNRAVELVHACVDMELYEKGIKLVKALTYIEVYVEGDYSDCDGSPLEMHDLYEHDLLCGKFEDLVKECLYLIYMGNKLSNRAEKMYVTIINIRSMQTKLEDVLQLGNQELPEFEAFLPLWIKYLGEKKERRAEVLLVEAQSMVQDDAVLLENARTYAKTHPSLYRQLLEMRKNCGEDGETLEIGLEALEKIPVSYTIRGEIALQTATYAVNLGNMDVAEQCWMEAFRSDSSVVNYMRIRFLSGNPKRYTEQIMKTIDSVFAKSNQEHNWYECAKKQESENSIHTVEYCIMMFFEQRFDRMEEIGMKVDKALGWSSTFMKEGMALMLLLLFDGTTLPEGLCALRQRVILSGKFLARDFYRGTDRYDYKSDQEEFQKIFDVWKATVVLPEAERKAWLGKIESWMSKRTQAIMENNRRNYYAECASYIAAIGEVQQSLGDTNAKARIMEKYRQEYSRRRNFHAQLRNFGMKK